MQDPAANVSRHVSQTLGVELLFDVGRVEFRRPNVPATYRINESRNFLTRRGEFEARRKHQVQPLDVCRPAMFDPLQRVARFLLGGTFALQYLLEGFDIRSAAYLRNDVVQVLRLRVR